jgi:hypothetical protein
LCKLRKPIFACALLAGCAVEPVRPTFYAPPDQQPAALASVIGARTTSGYTSDRTTYLAAVDGLPVENARENFAHAIQVAPGYRTLTVAHARDSLAATSEVTTELQAGRTYFLKAEPAATDAAAKNGQGAELYEIWLEDSSTREVAGVRHLAKLNAITDNMPGSANDFSDPSINVAAGEFLIRLVGMVLEAMIETALAPDNHGSAGSPVYSGKQPSRGGESAPSKQAPSPAVKNPMPGKSAPQGDAQPGKMKIMMRLR